MKAITTTTGPRSLARRHRLTGSTCIVSLAVALATFADAAEAQTAAAGPASATPASAPEGTTVETVIVTAEKRSANLQSVPIAVNAITADAAINRGLTGTEALSAAVPGLVINNPANVGNPYLRGVGSNLFDPSSEQSVAMYVDGVYIAAPESNLFSFNNISRIEILKGPQGTLFGRNATGGVIQIITRDPSHDPHADLSVGYGAYNDLSASGYATTGLGDRAAADVAFLYENQGDGYGRDLTTGSPTFREAIGNYAIRSKLLLTPLSGTKIVVSADFSRGVSTSAYQKPPGVFSPIDGSTYPGKYNALGDLDDRNTVNTGGGSVQIDQDLGFAHLRSISAYRKTVVTYALDDDVTRIPAADVVLTPRDRNLSQELQLSGPDQGWLKWLLGGYYYSALGAYSPVKIDGAEQVADQQQSTSYAGFGQATAVLPLDTRLTLGARYTSERQSYTLTFPFLLKERQSFDKLTYRFAVDHSFTKNVLGYISYNRGFKTGGFNLLAPGNNFKPETLDASEIGLKNELFDRRLRVNASAFYYDYKNIQLSLPIFGGLIVTNAAAAHIKGVEADFEAVPVDHLTLSGGLSLLDGRYVNYPGAIPQDQNGVPSAPINEAGDHTAVTPPFTGTLSADYLFTTPIGTFRPSATLIYNDGFFWQSDNRLTQPAYTLVNASVTWRSPDRRYDVRLWGKNLTNATYYIARITVTGIGDAQEQAAPSTYGVTVSAHF